VNSTTKAKERLMTVRKVTNLPAAADGETVRWQHDALDALVVGITTRRVNFIFDADVASFFDSVSQNWLVRFVEHRIGDKRIIRLIRKWLKAGVLEDGVVTVGEIGTGQGSVISPLLANIYMHYVFDLWANRWRQGFRT
jgi:RNA-directed DNA polymerase